MKADDFNMPQDIRFNSETGITMFRDNRLLIFDANTIGLLRQIVIEEFGWDSARDVFLQFGYQSGYSDFMQMKRNYNFDTEMELLASGPVIHTYEGIVKAVPKEISFDREKGEFYFTGTWHNSYEAEQHLSYNEAVEEPVCWTLMGYASGWCTAFFGKPLIAIEPKCMGMGDDVCEWKIQPPDVWGEKADLYLRSYEKFWKE